MRSEIKVPAGSGSGESPLRLRSQDAESSLGREGGERGSGERYRQTETETETCDKGPQPLAKLDPILMTSFNLNYLAKTYLHVQLYWRLRLQHRHSRGATI